MVGIDEVKVILDLILIGFGVADLVSRFMSHRKRTYSDPKSVRRIEEFELLDPSSKANQPDPVKAEKRTTKRG